MSSLARRPFIQGAFFLALMYLSIGQAPADQLVTLTVNGHKITATVAKTFAQREKGLMNRRSLARDEGMLFVFPQAAHYSMWMKDTPIHLDVAFIDKNGSIINIEKMQARSLDQHSAQKPAKYALEMNAGWFHGHGAKAGDSVQGLGGAGEGS